MSTTRHSRLGGVRVSVAAVILLGSVALIPVLAAPASAEVRSIVFPVAGGASWTDTWGAPRSGGRTHEGQDLFAPKMRHLVSTVDGTIARMGRGLSLSGNYVVVRDAQGWEYLYIHVNNDRPGTDDGSDLDLYAFPPGIYPGAAVYAGQHIGYLGDSGNAETTPSHLHFEIRKPNGSGGVDPINPADSLRAARHEVLDPTRISGVPFGTIDSTKLVPNGVAATGWAIDPDLTTPVRLEAYVDHELLTTFTAPLPRPDVGAAYPANGPDHGYDSGFVMPAGSHELCLAARNDVGPASFLGCRNVSRPLNPIGALDQVVRAPGGVQLAGWAIDADTDAAVTVSTSAGGTTAQTSASLVRSDLTSAFPGFGPAHGFNVMVPSGPGRIDACATAHNAAGSGSASVLACRSMELRSEPVGAVDVLRAAYGSITMQGWALDPDTAASIEIHAYVDGRGFNLGVASGARPDVAAAFPGWGANHGFGAAISAGPGSHSVCLFAISQHFGSNTLLVCRTVQMESGPPFGVVDLVASTAGGVRVAGWAIDPDTSESVEIHVYVDGVGHNLGPAAAPRGDIAQAYTGAGPNHGFDATIATAPGARPNTCVFAVDRAGGQAPTLLSCRRP